MVRVFNGFVLMHLPFGFPSGGSFPFVKHHGFLHPNDFVVRRVNMARGTSGLPITTCCGSVGSASSGLSLLSRWKEKPLLRVSTTKLPCKCWLQQNKPNHFSKTHLGLKHTKEWVVTTNKIKELKWYACSSTWKVPWLYAIDVNDWNDSACVVYLAF